jgi:tRNA pseudouridine38-40 synthase
VHKYSLLIFYVGTDFCGWQKQKEQALSSHLKPSIQGTIEKAILKMSGETVSLVGSGRTDAGVHSLGQVAHFVLKKKEWDPYILTRGLNGILPPSIRVMRAKAVAIEFHAQRSALKKQYSYYLQQGPCPVPHLAPVSRWIHKDLNLEKMREALDYLVGKHDFKPFQASGAKVGTTVREILEVAVDELPLFFPGPGLMEGDMTSLRLIRIRIIGTGFLKQMVRGIAGTLLEVGEERRPPSCTREILASGRRSDVGPTAPARGLWLEKVWY